MIYRAIVERKLRNTFDALNRGDYEPVLGSFGSPVEHTFFGDHALAGSRHGMNSIGPWYNRLKTVFPDLHFDIDAVAVSGMPWNTTAMIEWRDRFTLRDGSVRGNQGVHVIKIKWGRVISLQIYCDTQLLASVLDELKSQGVKEAGLAPINDLNPSDHAEPIHKPAVSQAS
jgi:ketosteroid isomerase-like protein